MHARTGPYRQGTEIPAGIRRLHSCGRDSAVRVAYWGALASIDLEGFGRPLPVGFRIRRARPSVQPLISLHACCSSMHASMQPAWLQVREVRTTLRERACLVWPCLQPIALMEGRRGSPGGRMSYERSRARGRHRQNRCDAHDAEADADARDDVVAAPPP